ncbi:MAG: hypothetical protein QM831_30215 [Kofleriaceae bacterium]
MVPALVVASLGTVLVLVSIVQLWGRKIAAHSVDEVVTKLARAKNFDRIIKFAAAAPNSYVGVLADAVRAGQKGEPTASAYEASGQALDHAWRAISLRGIVGAALGGAGLYLGYTASYSSQTLRALGGLSALAGVYFLFHLSDIRRALANGREGVLPEIDRAFTGVESEQ